MNKELEPRPSDRELAEWLLATLRMYGAEEATSHKIIGIFLDGLNSETKPNATAA